jgi:DNA-binding transcriptional MocR family regulator
MLLLRIDENSRVPLYRQIMNDVRDKAEAGTLTPGEKLPSTRALAEKLGVHRSTVALAYQELWALGFIDLRPGACPRVRERKRIATSAGRAGKNLVDWRKVVSNPANAVLEAYDRVYRGRGPGFKPTDIDFSSLDMDRRLFPLENFRACLNRALKKQGAGLLGYGRREGYPPLREYLTGRLRNHGIAVTPDEVLVTNGSQQALDLIFRLFASPGRSVAIESPTYGHALPLIRFCGLEAVEIPLLRDGMDLAVLERKIEKERPALIYTMPNFQNPSGVSTGQAHRERLLSLCEKHRVPLLEDGYDEEMKYFGRVVLPVKSMDRHGLVIYCGTFSKILFPGIRIGWIVAAKDLIDRLTALRSFSELASSMILQAAVHEFCGNGSFDRHVSKMHRVFRKRMQTFLRTLRASISPEWAEWAEPSGGYLVWLRLKPGPDKAFDWQGAFAARGLRVTPGRNFFYSRTAEPYVRLSISTLDEREIVEGVRRLAAALTDAHSRRSR